MQREMEKAALVKKVVGSLVEKGIVTDVERDQAERAVYKVFTEEEQIVADHNRAEQLEKIEQQKRERDE